MLNYLFIWGALVPLFASPRPTTDICIWKYLLVGWEFTIH